MSDVVQDMSPVNSNTLSSNRSDAVLQNAHDQKQDRNVVNDDNGVVRQELKKEEDGKLEVEIAAATCLNDIVQEKQGLEAAAAAAASLNVAVSENTGEQGFPKEETVKIANDDVVQQEFKGEETADTTACSNDIVLEEQENQCFQENVEYAGDINDAVSQEPASGSAADDLNDVGLGIQEPKETGEIYGAVSGVQEILGFDEKLKNKTNKSEGSVRCSLKVEVIDETALVEASAYGRGVTKESKTVNFSENSRKNVNNKRNEWQETGGNKGKRTRRKGKGGKNKNSGADVKEKNLDDDLGFTCNSEIGLLRGSDNDNGEKKVYSRNVLEAFRFVGLEWQKKKWAEVYCGLGPAVQMEYDGLVDSNTHNQYRQKHIRVDFNPRLRNLAPPSIFGAMAAKGRRNHLGVFVH